MKTILSYGGGVNSTAILALYKLGELPWPDYIVFSDTGAEWPHTYSYINYMEEQGIQLIYLTGGRTGQETLIEYCQRKKLIPSPLNRWCTTDFKRLPMLYFSRACDAKQLIGIDAGEEHRAKDFKNKEYPLIDLTINRRECKEIIKKAGWGVPQKSGCYVCPYQGKAQWIRLKKEHPELFQIAVDLEANTNQWTFKQGMTIEQFVADLDRQEELDFGAVLDQRCECYFD